MVNAALPYEEGYALNHLQYDASHRPHIYHCRVLSGSEYQLWSTVASRTDVRQVGLVGQDLRRSEITNNRPFVLDQNIVRLYIPVTDVQRMNIIQPPEYLISDELDIEHCQPLLPIVLYVVEQIPIVIMHYDAQVLTSILNCSVGPDDFHHELPIQHGYYLDLSVLVLGVLVDFLYGY